MAAINRCINLQKTARKTGVILTRPIKACASRLAKLMQTWHALGMNKHAKTLGPVTPGFDYQSYPFYLLSRASGRYNAAMEAALKPLDLDQARWRILLVLTQHEALGTQEIANKVVYKLSTTTRMVQRLERDGFVTTQQSQADGRIRNVRITAQGRSIVDKSRPLAQGVYEVAFEGITAADIATFTQVLKTIDDSLR